MSGDDEQRIKKNIAQRVSPCVEAYGGFSVWRAQTKRKGRRGLTEHFDKSAGHRLAHIVRAYRPHPGRATEG